MNPSTAYDITRLVTRVLNVTPNGIDRIDFALARHFLAKSEAAGMMATGLGPRVLPGEKARAAVEAIGAHWGEEAEPENDPGYLRVRAELLGTAPPPAGRAAPRIAQEPPRRGRASAAPRARGGARRALQPTNLRRLRQRPRHDPPGRASPNGAENPSPSSRKSPM
jgi:hypothetical protein